MSSQLPPVPPPPPAGSPAPVVPPARKGTSPLVWVAVGCGALAVLALVAVLAVGWWGARKIKGFAQDADRNPAVAAVKVMAAMDPDIEIVSSDDAADTVTIRNKKTGQVITVDAEDIKRGRLRFTDEKGEQVTFEAHGEGDQGSMRISSEKGEMTFGAGAADQAPGWVPVLPGSTVEGTYAATSDEGRSGGFGYSTTLPAADVLKFYREKLEGDRFKVSATTFDSEGRTTGGVLSGEAADGRSVGVTTSTEGGKTSVAVTYQAKR